MSNCSCNGENQNCFYCDGTGVKRSNKKIIIVKNVKISKDINKTSKLNFTDLKQKIKTYTDESLKRYKNNLLLDFKKSFHDKRKEAISKLIDVVTLELVSRNLKVGIKKNNIKKNSPQNRAHKKKSNKVRQKFPNKLTNNKKHITYKGKQMDSKTSLIHQKSNYKEIEKKLDASRDFYQYRETGKFGSHSSYDDHGDESFA